MLGLCGTWDRTRREALALTVASQAASDPAERIRLDAEAGERWAACAEIEEALRSAPPAGPVAAAAKLRIVLQCVRDAIGEAGLDTNMMMVEAALRDLAPAA